MRVPEGDTPRVLVVVGTRPEAIKMAPVVEAFRERGGEVEARLVLTGQHSELVDEVLARFELEPDFDLGIMREGQTLYDVIHAALDGLRGVVAEARPHALLVQGDTASVFVGSLVGFLERLAVGHVEAGLRSRNKWAPWPEEVFRRLTDQLSDWYFAPTGHSVANLRAEGVPPLRLHLTGNTVVDALHRMADPQHAFQDPALAAAAASDRELVLLTAHRRESFGPPLREIFRGVRELADAEPGVEVVYPVHPNPHVAGAAREMLGDHERIRLTDPVGYPDLLAALARARVVLTDSGGIQEEAPTFGTPVLVLRDVTERPEGVEAGAAELVGTDRRAIVRRARALLAARRERGPSAARVMNPYGDGKAARRIADIVVSDLTGAPRRTRDWEGP